MYGLHVHRAVLASGDPITGASVHVVDADYDTGPVVAQRQVPVLGDDTPDTLAERVQVAERQLVVDLLGDIVRGKRLLPLDAARQQVPSGAM